MGESIRVLHVDDEPGFGELAAEYLEGEDDRLEVRTAASAQEALERFGDGQFDCVVSDYDMPGTNGIELLHAVRERDPDLPFILFTGKGSEGIASTAISAGVTDYLQKERGSEQYEILANRVRNAVESHRARRAAEASDSRLRRVYERITDGFFGVDTDWRYTYVNEEGARLVGREREELLGQVVWEAFPALVDSPFEGALRTAMESQETTTAEGYYPPHETWYDVVVYPAADGISIYFQDVSERKAHARALKRYESIVEASGDPVYTIDDEGRFTFVNDRLTELTGYDETELVGEDVSIVLDDDDRRRGTELISELLSDPERSRGKVEMEIITAAGDRVPTENNIALLPSEEGFRGTVGTLRDITDRKARERELRRQNERLDEFADVVSHDLRNPLNVAEGQLQLLAEECDSDRVEEVAWAHDRMSALIDDLLEFARLGEEATDVSTVALQSLAEECWQSVAAPDATVDVDVEGTIRADAGRLTQLLENLFRNAVEHGGPDVAVTVGTLDDGFYVEDDGPGIPPGVGREHVFESGYSTTEDGTGFGLAIVKQIADNRDWTVRVTEAADGGARFEFTDVTFMDA